MTPTTQCMQMTLTSSIGKPEMFFENSPMHTDVAAKGLHVGQEVEVPDGQAAVLQIHHGADVHDVWQEGRSRNHAASMLQRRQCLHARRTKMSVTAKMTGVA